MGRTCYSDVCGIRWVVPVGRVCRETIRHRIATGPRRGQALMRLGDRVEAEGVESSPGKRCAERRNFGLRSSSKSAYGR
jgi:hypothetical protein